MAYPMADEMAKNLVQTLGSNYFDKDQKVKHWIIGKNNFYLRIIDFIESAEGVTYLLQIKSFRFERIYNVKDTKKSIMKNRAMRLRKSICNDALVKGIFNLTDLNYKIKKD
jgi:hypothetical protein